jgi:hypothetical protein
MISSSFHANSIYPYIEITWIRYDVIKQCCSRWSGCLEKVSNAPPSVCNIDESFFYHCCFKFLCYFSLQANVVTFVLPFDVCSITKDNKCASKCKFAIEKAILHSTIVGRYLSIVRSRSWGIKKLHRRKEH